jgi:membrane protein implicated in regulation of membrane protease activity
MSASTRFLLLAIIGIAISVIGMHLAQIFVGMAFLVSLMITFYGLPFLAVLLLLVIAWRLIWGIGAKPNAIKQSKSEQIKPKSPSLHIEIERDLNRMKHQLGQMNKKNNHDTKK